MKLHDFLTLCNNYDDLVQFLIDEKVIHSTMKCMKCESEMTFHRKELMFRCRRVFYVQKPNKKKLRKQCDVKIRAFHNTWFEHAHLPIQTICRFIACHIMLMPPRQEFTMKELGISSSTAVHWASFCRELCVLWIEKNSVQIGGKDTIVEIDEAEIGKRKYNKGHILSGEWIFGGIEISTKKLFIEPVKDRTAETLLGAIKKWIKPGTTIISDAWKSYNCLDDDGYYDLTVNHKMNFVDPSSGAHTQNIERTWRDTRASIPRYGHRSTHYAGYIGELFFRRTHDVDSRIPAFFAMMRDVFPVTSDAQTG
ncbi:uncharacterized protein LOC143153468 [Ptiloglossa arizonensis]|uniref:uncharacterized protein LOC143153468 n=1 Tax=Ptiloglossa arizonensis TaxID=3350558 RepID=UPI003F9F15AE